MERRHIYEKYGDSVYFMFEAVTFMPSEVIPAV